MELKAATAAFTHSTETLIGFLIKAIFFAPFIHLFLVYFFFILRAFVRLLRFFDTQQTLPHISLVQFEMMFYDKMLVTQSPKKTAKRIKLHFINTERVKEKKNINLKKRKTKEQTISKNVLVSVSPLVFHSFGTLIIMWLLPYTLFPQKKILCALELRLTK